MQGLKLPRLPVFFFFLAAISPVGVDYAYAEGCDPFSTVAADGRQASATLSSLCVPDSVLLSISDVSGEPVGEREFEAPFETDRLNVDISDFRPPPYTAGLYNLRWSALTTDGRTVVKETKTTVGCPALSVSGATLDAETNQFIISFSSVDVCQGPTEVSLSLLDVANESVEPIVRPFDPDGSSDLRVPLSTLKSEHRYTGQLSLSNPLIGSSSIPIELVTGCGPFSADIEMSDNRARGTLFASQCHFPVTASLSVLGSDGDVIQTNRYTLSEFDVDIPIPDPSTLPAGDHVASLKLTSAISRTASFEQPLSVSCSAPNVVETRLATRSDDDQVNLEFNLNGIRRCLSDSILRVQLRDSQELVVFNTAVDLEATEPSRSFQFPISAVPGTVYFASITTQSTALDGGAATERVPLTYDCLRPEVLDFGYSSPDSSSVSGVVRLASCNTPAAYRLVVRNSDGMPVARAEEDLVPVPGAGYALVPPLSLDHLEGGSFTATFVVLDNEGAETTHTQPLLLDTNGPSVTITHKGRPVTASEPIKVVSLSELGATVSDPSGLLFSPEPVSSDDSLPSSIDLAVSVLSVADQNASRVRIVGVVDLPRERNLGVDAVLFRAPDGSLYRAPVTGTYLSTTRADGDQLSFDYRSLGFVISFSSDRLEIGRYSLDSLLMVDSAGNTLRAAASSEFRKSPFSYENTNATLTRGVLDHPLEATIAPSGEVSFSPSRSIYDGRYTLSFTGFDRFGNASGSQTAIVDLVQEKETIALSIPAVKSFSVSLQHRFQSKSDPSRFLPRVRLVAKIVSGSGRVSLNGQELSQTATDLSSSLGNTGSHSLTFTLQDPDTDAGVVLHSETDDIVPLLVRLSTYRPEFRAEPVADSDDRLRIRLSQPSCNDLVVITQESVIDSLTADSACAIRFDESAVQVRAKSPQATTIGLGKPLSVSPLEYTLGFLVPTPSGIDFLPTESGTLTDQNIVNLTPSIRYVPSSSLAAQSDSPVTRTGPFSPGLALVEFDQPGLVVEVNGESRAIRPDGRSVRIPFETSIDQPGGTQTFDVRAYYSDYPEHAISKAITFTAVPRPVQIESTGGALITTRPLSIDLRIASEGGGPVDPTVGGTYQIDSVSLAQVGGESFELPRDTILRPGEFELRVPLGNVDPGKYRLSTVLKHNGATFSPLLKPIVSEVSFNILDGSPLESDLYTFRTEGVVPFVGHLGLQHHDLLRGRDLGNVVWEVSDDGSDYEVVQRGPRSLDFVLQQPTSRFYRARLLNRHSDTEYVTPPVELVAYNQFPLSVDGPSETFRSWPATYTAKAPPEHEVTWTVTGPHAEEALVVKGHTLTFTPPVTGSYYIECKSVHPLLTESLRTAPRVFRTLHASWPKIPAPVISGPTQVEPGATARFTVEIPDIFAGGNAGLDVTGEWELPDGTRAQTPWVDYTRPAGSESGEAETVLYHAWVKDAKPATLISAAHNISPWQYSWPEWGLAAQTESTDVPAFVRISLKPPTWRDWLSLGEMDLNTTWRVPPNARVRTRTDREIIVQLPNDRPFAVEAVVSDTRGNVSELLLTDILPLRTAHFEIALRLQAERTLHTAPIRLTAITDSVIVPKNDRIDRLSYYLNDNFVGSTDGDPLDVEIRKPGRHEVRVVATSGQEHLARASAYFDVGDNQPADCAIVPIGDLRLNGVAKAECDDPDGEMVRYKWYVDGQPVVGAGPRVQIPMREVRHLRELTLVAVDSGGVETSARLTLE